MIEFLVKLIAFILTVDGLLLGALLICFLLDWLVKHLKPRDMGYKT